MLLFPKSYLCTNVKNSRPMYDITKLVTKMLSPSVVHDAWKNQIK